MTSAIFRIVRLGNRTAKAVAVLRAMTIGVLLFATIVCHAEERCGDRADDVLFRVKSWPDLAAYWEQFPGCNDGYFGEHISELVTAWLAARPSELKQLTIASAKHPALMKLVTAHIDMTVNPDRIEKIRKNAYEQCPAGSEETCEIVLTRIRRLREEVAAELARERRQKE